jgi:hypothetical protein
VVRDHRRPSPVGGVLSADAISVLGHESFEARRPTASGRRSAESRPGFPIYRSVSSAQRADAIALVISGARHLRVRRWFRPAADGRSRARLAPKGGSSRSVRRSGGSPVWDFAAGVLLIQKAGGLVAGLNALVDPWHADIVVAGTPETYCDNGRGAASSEWLIVRSPSRRLGWAAQTGRRSLVVCTGAVASPRRQRCTIR